MIGDHGTSQVFLWSTARIAGVPVTELAKKRGEKLDDIRTQLERDVRYANITIIEGHDASQYGIGIVSARIAEIVLRDERAAIPIGSYQREFGVTLSLPSIVGHAGVARSDAAGIVVRGTERAGKKRGRLEECTAESRKLDAANA